MWREAPLGCEIAVELIHPGQGSLNSCAIASARSSCAVASCGLMLPPCRAAGTAQSLLATARSSHPAIALPSTFARAPARRAFSVAPDCAGMVVAASCCNLRRLEQHHRINVARDLHQHGCDQLESAPGALSELLARSIVNSRGALTGIPSRNGGDLADTRHLVEPALLRHEPLVNDVAGCDVLAFDLDEFARLRPARGLAGAHDCTRAASRLTVSAWIWCCGCTSQASSSWYSSKP